MSLIRNGGFESGNTEFWTVETGGTLDIDSVNQKYGTYCGKFISSGDDPEDILSNDYIEVVPYQIISIGAWIKSIAARKVYPILYIYDADYSYVETLLGVYRWMDGTYLMLNSQFVLPLTCSYVRFGYRIVNSNAIEEFYLDGAIVNRLLADSSIDGVVELFPLGTIDAAGATTLDKKDMKQFSTYYAQLMCSGVAGTSPTLDVTVYEFDEFVGEIILGTFTQVTAPTNERIDLPRTQGNSMYIRYVVGGTDPAFNVGIAVIGKA